LVENKNKRIGSIITIIKTLLPPAESRKRLKE